jgi:hypothetical protein
MDKVELSFGLDEEVDDAQVHDAPASAHPHSQTGTTCLDALLPAYRRLRRMADMMPDPEATTLDEESQAD